MTEFKCPNCGSNLKLDEEQIIRFCPSCGASMDMMPETERLKLILKEREMHQKKQEEKETNRTLLICLGIAIAFMIFIGAFSLIMDALSK